MFAPPTTVPVTASEVAPPVARMCDDDDVKAIEASNEGDDSTKRIDLSNLVASLTVPTTLEKLMQQHRARVLESELAMATPKAVPEDYDPTVL